MKKLIAYCIALLMLFQFPLATCATENNYLYDLVSLNIIRGDGNGDYRLDDPMTRGEFAACVTRLLDYESAAEQTNLNCPFEDVNPDAWYADEICLLHSMNIIDGVSDTQFAPDSPVEYYHIVKIIVNVLGYGVAAEDAGGYPDGYIMIASKLGILSGVSTENFSRDDIMKAMHNALDVELLETWGDGRIEKHGNTLRELLMKTKPDGKLFEDTGIVTANADTYLFTANADFSDSEIEIDGIRYQTEGIDLRGLLGKSVQFYAVQKDNGTRQLISIRETKKNLVTEVMAEDLLHIDSDYLYYTNDSDREIKLALDASCTVVKNGRVFSQYPTGGLSVQKGSITAIDNNGDKAADVLFLEEYYNVKVEEVLGTTIVLAGNGRINGKKYVPVQSDSDTVRMVIYNENCERIAVSELSKNAIISVIASEDGTLLQLIVSGETIEGTISEISGNEVLVNDQLILIHEGDSFDIAPGDEAVFRLDYRGYLAAVEAYESVASYAYVLASHQPSGLDSNLQVKVVLSSAIEMRYGKNEDNLDDTDLIPSIVCQNEEVKVLEVATNLKIDGVKFEGASIPAGLYRYTLNSEGQIRILQTPVFAGGGNGMKYNVYDKTFGAHHANYPIGINEDTVVLCVPKNIVASDKDYLVPLEINGTVTSRTFDVFGYDYDAESKKVKSIVFYEVMDHQALPVIDPISSSPAVGMVSKAVTVADENGELCLKLSLVSNSGEEEYLIEDLEGNNHFFAGLKFGDLIYFAKGLDGKLANYQLICSISNLSDTPFYKNRSTVNEQIFGSVCNIEYEVIDGNRNILVNTLEMACEEVMQVDVRKRNAPPVFLFDTSAKKITLGSFNDIVPNQENESLFLLRPYSVDVRVCVVVR